MRIQEMKPGILHSSKKKMGIVGLGIFSEEVEASATAVEDRTAQVEEAISESELDAARWSVVSFHQLEAGGLSYTQAAALMAELDANEIAGLCIVTDEAANRI